MGSPPHTWRIQYQPVRLSGRLRITSTYVENTASLYQIQSPKRDHLHIRGEYPRRACPIGKSPGSPPHTWRIQGKMLFSFCLIRITSTYVENTFLFCLFVNVNKDHLHIRGEYSSKPQYSFFKSGSPPHTWRIRLARLNCLCFLVITSKYVENTMSFAIYSFSLKYHLHIRGEYLILASAIAFLAGSPPHTWRIQVFSLIFARINGITSTYVENTFLIK